MAPGRWRNLRGFPRDRREVRAAHAADAVRGVRAVRRLLRGLFNRIKAVHGQSTPIHVFPVLPASLAVETGRVWMPKADVPLRLYDQNGASGFAHAFDIGHVPTGAREIEAA